MISKKSFVLAYEALTKEDEIFEKLSALVRELHGDIDFEAPVEEALRSILVEEMADTNRWIEWWRSESKHVWWIEENGETTGMEIHDASDFYDFLASPKSKSVCPYEEADEFERKYRDYEHSQQYLIDQAAIAKQQYEYWTREAERYQ